MVNTVHNNRKGSTISPPPYDQLIGGELCQFKCLNEHLWLSYAIPSCHCIDKTKPQMHGEVRKCTVIHLEKANAFSTHKN